MKSTCIFPKDAWFVVSLEKGFQVWIITNNEAHAHAHVEVLSLQPEEFGSDLQALDFKDLLSTYAAYTAGRLSRLTVAKK